MHDPWSAYVHVAWAAQVSLAQLGARLTAYTDTKASITTFRLVARKSQSQALGNLPEEIHEMIASEVRELVFQREIEPWGVRSGCLNDVYFQEAERGETYDRRLKEMEDWGNILTSLDGDLDFAKRMRMIARDFGIRPFFLVNGWADKERRLYCAVDTKAYLILPVDQGYWSPVFRNKVISQVSKRQIDLSLYEAMSKDQVGRFATAAPILKLHANDKHEEESGRLTPRKNLRNCRVICEAMAKNITIFMMDGITEKDPAWP
ncbi:MAG: hypothetical protein L6R36_008792, partial [Xanthoria steineri]